jgi:gamma-glutamyltranspeptidase/glutathione hydrolase
VLDSAIDYARNGFPITERLSSFMEATRSELLAHDETAAIFLPQGVVPRPGTRLVNTRLARTLESIGDDGWSGFYEGPTARAMAAFAEKAGGFFSIEDFSRQTANWGEPLTGRYHDVTIYNTPPPTQGLAVLQMLNLLEPYELRRRAFLGPDHIHLLVQAKQLAYHDRDRFLADPDFSAVPTDRLLTKEYARERGRLIDMNAVLPWDKIPSFGSLSGDTVYVATIDQDGNAVSLIHSPSPKSRGLFLPRSRPSQPAGAGKDSPAHAHRVDRQTRWQAVERARLHGRGRATADPGSNLCRNDRFRPEHPGGNRNATVPFGPVRAW